MLTQFNQLKEKFNEQSIKSKNPFRLLGENKKKKIGSRTQNTFMSLELFQLQTLTMKNLFRLPQATQSHREILLLKCQRKKIINKFRFSHPSSFCFVFG